MKGKLTKWKPEKENRDGTGFTYYYCQCPQGGAWTDDFKLYRLHYSPTENRVWFFDEMRNDSLSIRMNCTNWETAENIKKLLTMGKSHWMDIK